MAAKPEESVGSPSLSQCRESAQQQLPSTCITSLNNATDRVFSSKVASDQASQLHWPSGAELEPPLVMKQNRAAPATEMDSTPLSGLNSGSLMRHLVALRKKQLTEQNDLPFDSGKRTNLMKVLADKQLHQNISKFKNVVNFIESKSSPEAPSNDGEFLTSTPNCISSESNNRLRYPLAELNLVNNNDNISEGHCPKLHSQLEAEANENSSPDATLMESPIVRPYNPESYKSPPKFSVDPHALKSKTNTSVPQVQAATNHLKDSSDVKLSDKLDLYSREEERPLSSMNKSFEEKIDEKLKERAYNASSTSKHVPRKQFLKRGSGTSRFNRRSSVEESPAAASLQINPNINSEKPRKIFPFLRKGAGTQRFQMKPFKLKKNRSPGIFSPVTDELVLQGAPDHSGSFTENPRESVRDSNNLVRPFCRDRLAVAPPTMSPIQATGSRESKQLKAFEALEELAEHSSFCSDASTVNHLLREGLDGTANSTPIASPARYRYNLPGSSSTPLIHKDLVDSPHPLRHDAQRLPTDITKTELSVRPKKSVQFCQQGAHIVEFCPEEVETASEAPTISDTSELFNVSDLELLNHLNEAGQLPAYLTVEKVPDIHDDSNSNVHCTPPKDNTHNILRQIPAKNVGPTHQPPGGELLQFSPPKIPPGAASYAVWQAFGSKPKVASENKVQTNVRSKPGNNVPSTSVRDDSSHHSLADASKPGDSEAQDALRKRQEELDAHKVLLVSKVHELEKEIKSFQRENVLVSQLKKTLAREREMFEREKKMFEETLDLERQNMEKKFERERNILWREKCSLESSKQSQPQKQNVLEVINLKEEVLVLKNELDKRDAMQNFTINKLRSRIKELTQNKKDMEEKCEKLNSLEKENMSLKHQVDRLKLTSSRVMQLRQPNSGPATSDNNNFKSRERFNNAGPGRGNVRRNISKPVTHKKKTVSFDEDSLDNSGSLNIRSPHSAYLHHLPSESDASKNSSPSSAVSSDSFDHVEETLNDGTRVLTYANGNKKLHLPSGCVVHEYYNGDRKETFENRIVYHYAHNGTKQVTYLDGSEELEFPNGQRELKKADTSIEITFPDSSKTIKMPDGTEVHHNKDGTVVTASPSGEKIFEYTSGQREVHGDGFKRREYPDGTVKVLFDDGSTQTTYPNGRIRVKDAHGAVISDTKLGIDLTTRSSPLC